MLDLGSRGREFKSLLSNYSLAIYGKKYKTKVVKNIKLISQKQLNELIDNGIIGRCDVYGNNNITGKHSSGYYDVKKYLKAKRETPDASERYLKTIAAHVGVSITRHKIYIEDEYVK